MTAEDPFQRRILSVRDITAQARRLLESGIGRVWIEGECSNVSTPASGHVYFTLKDDQSQLQAAWFRGRRAPGALLPANGMKLRVHGLITAYERGSQIQVLVEEAEDAGLGDLQKRFAELKLKLEREGLFDAGRKQPLPMLPRTIGVVTSPTGAAVRDILNVLTRRFPDRHVILAPVPVQGDAAAPSIARAIRYFASRPDVDVLIIGRGGGSLEDLWAFNEEAVARAIADCPLPVISAVGHETDFTISDFTADLRAPTPSAAAELVIGRREDFELRLDRLRRRLAGALDQRRLRLRHRLSTLRAHRLFHEPARVVATHRDRVSRAEDRLQRALLRKAQEPQRRLTEVRPMLRHRMETRLRDLQQHLDDLDRRRRQVMQTRTRDLAHALRGHQQQLQALNPYQVLRRGFSITRTPEGGVVSMDAPPAPGSELETLLHGGSIRSTVRETARGLS